MEFFSTDSLGSPILLLLPPPRRHLDSLLQGQDGAAVNAAAANDHVDLHRGGVAGTHLFHIAGYSLHERLGPGSSVRSAPFSVGGYDWAVRFFPDGGEGGALVLLLELLTKDVVAKASCHFRFLNQATGKASPKWQVWNLLMYAQDDGLTIECAVTVVKDDGLTIL
ncbi:BTB/POZ and MATH domain-containing protein 3-like [Miscanthus floridulus]|uniref:BTB/POZ and MATH domain-containing protein 3-like n=1 Tax=Miscanthus floridulus TaxID=154761 RepID=UPI0034588EE8